MRIRIQRVEGGGVQGHPPHSGGAAIGADASSGVVDERLRAFGYENVMIVSGSLKPANPEIGPGLTFTAFAEHVMAQLPSKAAA